VAWTDRGRLGGGPPRRRLRPPGLDDFAISLRYRTGAPVHVCRRPGSTSTRWRAHSPTAGGSRDSPTVVLWPDAGRASRPQAYVGYRAGPL